MKIYKKILAAFIAVMLSTAVFCLTACNNNVDNYGEDKIESEATAYTVTFKVNGGVWSDGTDLDKVVTTDKSGYISTADFPENPTREGDIFGGWVANADGTGTAYTSDSVFTVNKTLYAKWNDKQTLPSVDGGNTVHTITLNPNGGVLVGEVTVKTGENGKLTELPAEPAKADNIFIGWYTAIDGGTEVTTDYAFTDDCPIYAHWVLDNAVPQAHTVTFDANGGKWSDNSVTKNRTTVEDGKVSKPFEDPARDDYIFAGWYVVNDGVLGDEWNFDSTVTADMTLKAKWIAELTVTFLHKKNGETYKTVAHIAPYSTLTAEQIPVAPDREGYRFLGWKYMDGAIEKTFTISVVIKDNITVYGEWEAVKLSVTFYEDKVGKEYVKIENIEYNTALGDDMPDSPMREGCDFCGWAYDDAAEVKAFDKTTLITEDMSVYATWETLVKITFNANGGNIGDKDKVEFYIKKDTPIGNLKPADPTRIGYGFLGWFVGETEYADFDADVDNNLTLTAKWVEEHTVTFEWNYDGAPNDGVFAIRTVVDGDKVTVPDPAPERDPDKFVFNGWFADADGETEFKFDDAVTKNIDVYAKWTKLSQGFMIINGSTTLRMLDNTDNMDDDEKATYDLCYAFFGDNYVTLTEGDILTFKVGGNGVAFTLDPYSRGATLIAGTPTSLRISSTGDFDMYLKRIGTTKAWEIYIEGGEDDGRVNVEFGSAYMVGKFEGDGGFVDGRGYIMIRNDGKNDDGSIYEQWTITCDLHAGEIVKFRKDGTRAGYSQIEEGSSAKGLFVAGDGEEDPNIAIGVSGNYTFYFKPNNESNKIRAVVNHADVPSSVTGVDVKFAGTSNNTVTLYILENGEFADPADFYLHVWNNYFTTNWPGIKIDNIKDNSYSSCALNSSLYLIINKGNNMPQTGSLTGMTGAGTYIVTFIPGGGYITEIS